MKSAPLRQGARKRKHLCSGRLRAKEVEPQLIELTGEPPVRGAPHPCADGAVRRREPIYIGVVAEALPLAAGAAPGTQAQELVVAAVDVALP